MSTVGEMVALGVGGEITKALKAGSNLVTLTEMDLIRALAEAYTRGLEKGEALQKCADASIVENAKIWPSRKDRFKISALILGNDLSSEKRDN